MANELYHFGIKGMKWGVHRYQNEDGTLTSLGEKRAQVKTDLKKARRSGTKSASAKYLYSQREFQDAKTRLKIKNNRYVEQYRKDHPDTKLSANEILKMRDCGHAKR